MKPPISAARKCSRVPVHMSTLPPDTHMHTPLCKHAEGEPAEYVTAAAARDLRELIFCDHAPAPDGYDPTNRMLLEQFPEYRNAIRDLQESYDDAAIGFGIESDYYEGCTSFQSEWLPAQEFDLVIGSVHFIGDWGFDNPINADVWASVDVKGAWQRYFGLISELAGTGMYDVVGHLDLPKKFGHRMKDPDLKEAAQPALDLIAAAGMAIEINTGGLRKPVKEMYPSPLLLSLARERDIPVCFGSDAHSPKEVGHAFGEAVALAEEAGYNGYARFSGRRRTFTPFSDLGGKDDALPPGAAGP